MKLALASAAALAATAVLGAAVVTAAPASAPAAAGARVDDFQLTDTALMAQQLYYFHYAPAVVLMSRVEGSAASVQAAAALETLKAAYADRGVVFFMIDSAPGQSREAAAAAAAREHLTIPVLMDEEQLVGEGLGVKREGEVFVLDPKNWRVAYHGPVQGPGNASARDALDAVLAKRGPTVDGRSARD